MIQAQEGIAARVIEISDMMLSVQMSNLDTLYNHEKDIRDKELSDLNDAEEAALEAAGYGEKTALETARGKEVSLQKEVDDLWAAGRRKQAIEKETELKGIQGTLERLEIEDAFATKRQTILDEQEAAEKVYLNKRAQFEYQLAVNNKAIKIAEIGIAKQAAIAEVPLRWTKKGKNPLQKSRLSSHRLKGLWHHYQFQRQPCLPPVALLCRKWAVRLRKLRKLGFLK